MKYKLIALIALLFIGCNQKKTEIEDKSTVKDPVEILQPIPADTTFTIIPGVSVGETVLGNSTETLSVLGKPDFSDAAMGKAWLLWYKQIKEIPKQVKWMIYTTYKDNELKEKVISEIRINSGEYKTESGIGAGTSFEVIQKEFPKITEFAKYKNQEINKDIYIYDVPGSGIAFEFISYEGDYAKCTAVIVYPKNKTLNTDYILFLPERELKKRE